MIQAQTILPSITQKMKYPKLVRPQNMYRYISVLTILCLTTFHCGYCLTYTTALGSPNIALVYGSITKKPLIKAFLISSLYFGVTLGTFLNPWVIPLTSRRKMTLILCFTALFFQSILQIASFYSFIISRFLQGIVTGLLLELIPVYVKQLSPKQINKRGIFGIFGQVFVIIGFMVVFGVNNILLDSGTNQFLRWRIVVGFNLSAVLVIIMGILTNLIPESPNDLIQKGQIDKAKEVIRLFHRQSAVEEVYEQKLIQIEEAKKPKTSEGKSRPFSDKILSFQLPIMYQMTGVSALISQMGFVTARFHNKIAEYVPFMMGFTQVIATIYALIYFTKIKRKTLVIVGNLGMSLCCIGLGVMYEVTKETPQAFWTIVALIILYMAINGSTLVPGVWMFVYQIATKEEVRWSKVTSWLTSAVSMVLFIYIGQTFNYGEMFLVYGIFTMLCFVYNIFVIVNHKPKMKDIMNIELSKLSHQTQSNG